MALISFCLAMMLSGVVAFSLDNSRRIFWRFCCSSFFLASCSGVDIFRSSSSDSRDLMVSLRSSPFLKSFHAISRPVIAAIPSLAILAFAWLPDADCVACAMAMTGSVSYPRLTSIPVASVRPIMLDLAPRPFKISSY